MRAAALLLSLALLPPGAAGQEELPVPVPELAARPLPRWELGLSSSVASIPAYAGSDTRGTRFLLLPTLVYRGKIFRADQSGAGARVTISDGVELDIGFAGSLPPRNNDVGAREGMPTLGAIAEFGPRVKLTLARPTPQSRVRFDLPLRMAIEAKGGLRRQGWIFEPRLLYEWRDSSELWAFNTQVSLVVGDANVNRYFYGVQPQYATPTRPAYDASPGLMLTRFGFGWSRRLDRDFRVQGFVRHETYANSANLGSPLLKQSAGVAVGIGLAWTFARADHP